MHGRSYTSAISVELLQCLGNSSELNAKPSELTLLRLLGSAYLRHYKLAEDINDLDHAIECMQQLLAKLPADHYYQNAVSNDMAFSSKEALWHSQSVKIAYRKGNGSVDDLKAALQRIRKVKPKLLAYGKQADAALVHAIEVELLEVIYEKDGDAAKLAIAADSIARSLEMTVRADHNYQKRLNRFGRLLGKQSDAQTDSSDFDLETYVRTTLSSTPERGTLPLNLERDQVRVLRSAAANAHGEKRSYFLTQALNILD